MNTGENKCIRYLMKEMDPSEEMEFEQRMQEDENLLIEVESLRATKKKVAGLPTKNPPESVTKKIAYDAKQLQLKRINRSNIFQSLLKKGIAAAILCSALSGGYFYYSTFEETNEAQPATTEVSPWVDRNEILRYSNSSQSGNAAVLDSEVSKSYEKLQLVKFPAEVRGSTGIHLTGSSK